MRLLPMAARIILAAFGLALIACGGGTSNVGGQGPQITDVNPRTGASGDQITFTPSALLPGGDEELPTNWSWNFGGGATPNTANVRFPTVTLLEPGSYVCTVSAVNANGNAWFQWELQVTDGQGL